MPGTADERRGGSPDLSPVTLGLASLGSVAATVLVSRFGIAGSQSVVSQRPTTFFSSGDGGGSAAPAGETERKDRTAPGEAETTTSATTAPQAPAMTAPVPAPPVPAATAPAPAAPAAPVEPPVAPPSTAPAPTAPPGG